MPLVYDQRSCPSCEQRMLFQRQVPHHLIHFIASIATFGAWVIVWIIAGILSVGRPWRCCKCGSSPVWDGALTKRLADKAAAERAAHNAAVPSDAWKAPGAASKPVDAVPIIDPARDAYLLRKGGWVPEPIPEPGSGAIPTATDSMDAGKIFGILFVLLIFSMLACALIFGGSNSPGTAYLTNQSQKVAASLPTTSVSPSVTAPIAPTAKPDIGVALGNAFADGVAQAVKTASNQQAAKEVATQPAEPKLDRTDEAIYELYKAAEAFEEITTPGMRTEPRWNYVEAGFPAGHYICTEFLRRPTYELSSADYKDRWKKGCVKEAFAAAEIDIPNLARQKAEWDFIAIKHVFCANRDAKREYLFVMHGRATLPNGQRWLVPVVAWVVQGDSLFNVKEVAFGEPTR